MRIGGSSLAAYILVLVHATTILAAVLGIDFGQEYTKGALVAPGVPFEIVLTADSKRKDLSGLTFKKVPGTKDEIERVYGNSAQSLATRFPDSSAFYFKPLMGMPLEKSVDEVASYQNRFPGVSMTPSNNNRDTIAFNFHGETYPIEEVLGMSFANLKARAGQLLAENSGSGYVRDTAITVPYHFTLEQRRALEDAAEISGLKLISLVNDGVAVAVNFASSRSFEAEKQYHVIYDVGAGSTCATLVSIRQGEIPDPSSRIAKSGIVIEVEGVGYDVGVGGHLLTERVRDLLINKFLEANPSIKRSKLLADHRALAKLWNEANKVKYVLSANTETQSSVEGVIDDIDFRAPVTRDEFEQLTEDLRPRVSQPILDALTKQLNTSNAPVDIKKVDSIILTGGSVRVPFIQQELKNIFESVDLAKNVNADESALLGATLRGVGISKIFKSRDIHVIDRAIWDYTFSVGGNEVKTLFPRGTPLDTSITVSLDEVSDKDDFSLKLFEDSREFIRYDASKVQKTLKDVRENSKKTCVDETVLEAEFTLTNSRIVELTSLRAKCMATDKEASSSSSSSSSEEVSTDTTATASETESATTTSATTTSIAKPTKALTREVSVKPKFSGPRPMGTSSKNSAWTRLRTMDKADTDRRNKEEARNTLESNIYRVRDFLTNSDSLEEKLVEPALKKLEEFSNWLDLEGQSATLKKLNEKLDDLKRLHESFLPKETASSTTSSSATSTTEVSETASAEPAKADPETVFLRKLGFVFGSNREVNKALEEAGITDVKDIKIDTALLDEYVEQEKKDTKLVNDNIDDATKMLEEVLMLSNQKNVGEKGQKEVRDKIYRLENQIEQNKQAAESNRASRVGELRALLGLEKQPKTTTSSSTTTTTAAQENSTSDPATEKNEETQRVRDEL
ncbi:hypothetical protein TRICI_003299 [Trichomonascus ciferrii]|uniref:Actin-like ATPase domain-containing protein n=1 Tax=Trichomonascus ciferrii TaxID=44093 RepID=A0A642V3J7_9ASCO|nr:hypothetical protein TRICI_003299 [Trichomonascus ciferrii]